jgi:streptogramin lyase
MSRGRTAIIGAAAAAVLVAGGLVAMQSRDTASGPTECAKESKRLLGTGLHLAATEGAVYGASGFGLARFDACTLERTAYQRLPNGEVSDIVVGLGGVWIVADNGWVRRFDPVTLKARESIRVGPIRPGATYRLALGTQLWAVDSIGARVAQIDPAAATISRPFRLPRRRLTGAVAADGDRLWVSYALSGISLIGPRGTTVTRLVGGAHAGISIAAGRVWIVDASRGTLIGLDPTTARAQKRVDLLAGKRTGLPTSAPAVSTPGRIWVLDERADVVIEVDVVSTRVVSRRPIARDPVALTAAAGSVFAYDLDRSQIVRATDLPQK